jgi:menaquinone-dependent protoporphyrinogen oxidase
MKILVAYASRLGSTAGIAERMAARLRSHGLDAIARRVKAVADLGEFDAFVVGSAVYAGQWLREASRFVEHHAAVLSTHPVWLFSSGPVGERATSAAPIEPAGVRELREIARPRGHRVFAGALDRRTVDGADLGFGERFIAKRFVPEGDFRDWPLIDAWIDEIASDLPATRASRRVASPAIGG